MASKTTQDTSFIREWAEKRGAKPAEVASTETAGQPGILRLEFPGAPHANDSALKEIGWDEFFAKFTASGLQFLYEEETAGGETSNFNKLTYPEPASAAGKKLLKKAAAKKKTAAKKTVAAKTVTKKSAVKPVRAVKTAAKTPAPATKTAAKKTAIKKIAAKAAVPAKKTAAKTPVAAKTVAAAKKTAAKKVAVKAAAAKKTVAKKAAKKSR